MQFEWHDVVGGFGVAILLLTYLFLQLNYLSARSLQYSLLNALGASLILISLMFDFNKSAFAIEAAWLVISLIGAAVSIRDRRRNHSSSDITT